MARINVGVSLGARLASLALAGTLALAGGPRGGRGRLGNQGLDPVVLSFAIAGDSRIDPTEIPGVQKALPASAIAPKGDYTWDLLKACHYTDRTYATGNYPFFFNAVQLRLTLRDLAALGAAQPRYFFFLGDLVSGFKKDDGTTLRVQLGDFSKVLKMEAADRKFEIIPLPGNHETTFKEFKDVGKEGDKPKWVNSSGAWKADSAAWVEWMHKKDNKFPTRLAGNGPSGEEALRGIKLEDDQREMTYSFDEPLPDGSKVHFIILNTDTVTSERGPEGFEELGLLPLDWVTKDIHAAQANPAIRHIFLLSHKPVRPPASFKAAGPYDKLHDLVAEPLRRLMLGNSKVRALLCSHAHLWAAESLVPEAGDLKGRQSSHERPMMIVVGNGGTELEKTEKVKTPDGKTVAKTWAPGNDPMATWNPGEPHEPFYGFTMILVYRSGRVAYNSYQRPVPDPYYGRSTARAVPRDHAVEIVSRDDQPPAD